MTLTNDEKFALLQDMKVIDNNRKIVERLKKLPFGLILQHIRDSFSTDKQFMSDSAKIQTEKCIEDLMDLEKTLFGKPDPELNCPCEPDKPCGLHKIQFFGEGK